MAAMPSGDSKKAAISKLPIEALPQRLMNSRIIVAISGVSTSRLSARKASEKLKSELIRPRINVRTVVVAAQPVLIGNVLSMSLKNSASSNESWRPASLT